jgi:hypothetical protein
MINVARRYVWQRTDFTTSFERTYLGLSATEAL